MAINTGGFQTSVLPQFTPVNPSLAAFNPSAAMEGAGQAVSVAQGLEQLKNMRQIHEENAKMSAAKNKQLQAQAVREGILADYEAGMFSDKLTADKAEAAARRIGAEGKVKTTPGATDATIRAQELATRLSPGDEKLMFSKQNRELALAPGEERLAVGNQNILLNTQPFISQSAINEAKFKQDASAFSLAQQPIEQEVRGIANSSALATAPAAAEAARIAAGSNLINAQMAFNTASSDYAAGNTGKERVEASEINLRNAQAEAARATAQATAAKNDTAVRIAEIKSQAKEKMFEKLNNTSKLANELGRLPVVSPSDNTTTTMSQLADKYFQVDSEGNVNVFDKGMFMQDLATMNPSTRNDLTAYQDLQRLRSMLVKDLTSSIESNLPKQIEPPKTKLRWDAAAQKMVEVK
jgi:hypothetical protein